MLYYYIVYPLTHIDNISKRTTIEISMTIIKYISNHGRTFVYRTLIILVLRNFNFLNQDLFISLNFSFSLNRRRTLESFTEDRNVETIYTNKLLITYSSICHVMQHFRYYLNRELFIHIL